MAFVGGFLGGGVEMVPAGYGQLVLQWVTPDRENMKCSFLISEGTDAKDTPDYTVESDEYGYAEHLVPAGTYTVAVKHEGYYQSDGPMTVAADSAEVRYVHIEGDTMTGAILMESAILYLTVTITDTSTKEVYYKGAYQPQILSTGMCVVDVDWVSKMGGSISSGTISSLNILGLVHLDTMIKAQFKSIAEINIDHSTLDSIGSIQSIAFGRTSSADGYVGNKVPDKVYYMGNGTYTPADAFPLVIRITLGEAWRGNVPYRNNITFRKDATVKFSAKTDISLSGAISYNQVLTTNYEGEFEYPLTSKYYVMLVGGGSPPNGGGGGGGGAYGQSTSVAGSGGGGGAGGDPGMGPEVIVEELTRTAGTKVNVTIGRAGSPAEGGKGGAGGVYDSSIKTDGASGGRSIGSGSGTSTIFDGIMAAGGVPSTKETYGGGGGMMYQGGGGYVGARDFGTVCTIFGKTYAYPKESGTWGYRGENGEGWLKKALMFDSPTEGKGGAWSNNSTPGQGGNGGSYGRIIPYDAFSSFGGDGISSTTSYGASYGGNGGKGGVGGPVQIDSYSQGGDGSSGERGSSRDGCVVIAAVIP